MPELWRREGGRVTGNLQAPTITDIEVPRPGYLGGGLWAISGLRPITILFGKNGSGKSKLLREWRDLNRESNHYVLPERAGDIGYNAGYLISGLAGSTRRDESTRNFSAEYRMQVVARIQAYFAARGDHRGENLPTSPEELESLVQPLLPDFDIGLSGTKNPPYRLTRLVDGSTIANVDLLSSGETQVLTLAIDILTVAAIWEIQGQSPRLVLIDEPDAHIHPDLQVRFADFLVDVAKRFELQVVVATHSTTLLSAIGQFAKSDAGVAYLQMNVANYWVQPFTEVLRELSACLGGHALMGPLFGVPLLLVEGDDDYRIWSQVPRYHHISLSVIPAGGDEIKKFQRTLEDLFASLRDAGAPLAGYALIDSDKGKPVPSESNPQVHIRFVQLACHESENLYLTDEVLTFLNLDWDAASARIVGRASDFGNKAEQLAAAVSWNRQTVDLKGIIEEVASILDPKRVHWTLRVARALGTKRPTGQLEAFLGEEVVTSLWGADRTSQGTAINVTAAGADEAGASE